MDTVPDTAPTQVLAPEADLYDGIDAPAPAD